VLHNSDAGRTWTIYQLPAAVFANGLGFQAPGTTVVNTGSGAIVATRPDAAVLAAGGSLWRTTDDGRTCAQPCRADAP
jgi:hypothetical protein